MKKYWSIGLGLLTMLAFNFVTYEVYADGERSDVEEVLIENSVEAEAREISIDEEHFPDKEFRNFLLEGKNSWSQEYYDCNRDGVFSEEELQGVKEIDCSGRKIHEMAGIEYFTELEVLSCSDNNISTLDLARNPGLIVLKCQNNRLSVLDLTRQENLRSLDCSKNQLLSIAFPAKTQLETLRCDDNKLKTLQINNEKNMELLSCNKNRLADMEFGATPYISEISLNNNRLKNLILPCAKEISCMYNRLVKLDTTKGGNILKYLYCSYNDLETLDVSAHPSLREVICSYNQLTKLQINKDAVMRYVVCSYNRLTELNFESNRIRALNYSNNFVTSLKVGRLRELDCENNPIETLDLSTINGLEEIGDVSQYKVKYADAPKLTGISKNTEGIKLSWKYPKQCDGFYIYRKVKGGSWKKIYELRKKECSGKFAYTDKKAKKKKTYVYTVRAFRNLGNYYETQQEKDYLGTYDKTGLSIKGGLPPKKTKGGNI